MRISDLIPSPQAIITDDYWTQQNALGQAGRGWIEEGARESKDEGLTGNQQEANYSSGNDEPQDPGFNVTDEAKSREDEKQSEIAAAPKTQIKRNPAEINWDYAVVQRLNPADLSSQLLSFNLGRAMHDAHSSDNLSLEAGDVVTIFSQQDLQVPVEKRTKFVWVEGEVAAAGVYRVEPGENLRDLVARAGGLTPQAYLFASDFRRESTRIAQQEKLERMVDEMDRELRSRVTRVAANGNEEERKASKEEVDSEKSVIEKLRQTTPTGRVVLDLKPSDTEVGAIPALSLEDGDRIIIPPRSATVEVVGAVYNQNSFLYRVGKNIADYISQSGGGTRDADAQRLFVIRADGSVVSKQMHRGVWAGRFESLKLMPGDTIVMPERIRTGSLIREIRDWSQIFSQFALGAAAIRVISP
jgi:protein involved in polysaccharide export with SLBB domain